MKYIESLREGEKVNEPHSGDTIHPAAYPA